MPFTFSHPAIIVPFKKLFPNHFSTTGLVIGSIVPDFEYFLRLELSSQLSHTPYLNLIFNIPVGIVLAFVFHGLVKRPVVYSILWVTGKSRDRYLRVNWGTYFVKNWKIVLTSLIVGIYSHIVWDAFSHHNGFFVKVIPWLLSSVIIQDIEIHIYKLIQHLSSLAGLVILAILLVKRIKNETVERKPEINSISKFWIVALAFAVLVFFSRICLFHFILGIGNIGVLIIGSIFWGVICSSLLFKQTFD